MESVADGADGPERPSTFEEYNPQARFYSDQKRAAKRKAGIASGAARRKRAHHGPKHRRLSLLDGLSLSYRVQQIAYRSFERRFVADALRDNRLVSERGLETAWVAYIGHVRCYRVKGQDFRTTNRQRARAMALRGRPRCTRTMQRVDRRLAAMGLVRRTHVKRRGDREGQRDCLAVRLLQPFVALPSATATAQSAVVAVTATDSVRAADRDDQQQERAPPDGGGEAALRPPTNDSDERMERDGDPPASDVPEPLRRMRELREAEARDGVPAHVRMLRDH